MKLFTGLALAGILMAGTVSAQHVDSKNVNFGIKGGLNFYNINNDNNLKYDMLTGIHIGLLWHIHMSEHFALQPELLYSTQGAKYSDVKLNLSYVNIPVMFQYMFDNGFRLEAGPQVGFLVKAKVDVNGDSEDIKSDLNTLDLALGVGLGYLMPSGFGFDARYNIGLSNINDTGSDKSTNGGFQLGVFYQFGHK